MGHVRRLVTVSLVTAACLLPFSSPANALTSTGSVSQTGTDCYQNFNNDYNILRAWGFNHEDAFRWANAVFEDCLNSGDVPQVPYPQD